MGITITGLEADALAAKKAILGIVNQYESMIKEEVQIDPRVHSMIIGRRGRSIRKIIDHLKSLEEEYIQDAADKEWMQQYEKPNRQLENKDSNKLPKEFKVSKAPWDVSSS